MTRSEAVLPSDAEFFAQAEGWYVDFVLRERQSRAVAWVIAAVATAVAVLAVIALALLTPLKRVEPFVIRVDNSTGAVDIVQSLSHAPTTYEESITKYFLNEYVRDRESYSRDTVYALFNKVLLLSAAEERGRYKKLYERSNAESPLVVLGDYGKAEAKVSNISFLARNVAAIRFVRSVSGGPAAMPPAHMIATVTFQYRNAPMSEQARMVNPLGFQVTDYRTDPEVISNSVLPVTATPPVSGTGSNGATP